MARKNTPSSYACGSCGLHGHNSRSCSSKKEGTKSATQIMKEMRAAKRAARLARKPMQKATPIEEIVVESTISEIVEETPVATVASEIAEAFGMFNLPNVIVQDSPVQNEEVMGMMLATDDSAIDDEDAEVLAILRSLGVDV